MMKQRILVVDDDKLVADTLSLVFTVNGFDCEARYSASSGMERARSFGPELVVCDVTMPEGNGLQLADKLRDEMPGTQVIMFTAFGNNAAKVTAHSALTGHTLRLLNKPCRPEELLLECHTLLKSVSPAPIRSMPAA